MTAPLFCRRSRWLALALVLLGLLALPAAAWTGPVGSRAGAQGDEGAPTDVAVEVEVVAVQRLEHSTQLLVEISNPSGERLDRVGLNDRALGYVDERVFDDLSGIGLLDEEGAVEYLAFRDPDTNLCTCARLDGIDAGAEWTVWWRSAPLPADVEVVTVLGPDGEPLETDVEVTEP